MGLRYYHTGYAPSGGDISCARVTSRARAGRSHSREPSQRRRRIDYAGMCFKEGWELKLTTASPRIFFHQARRFL